MPISSRDITIKGPKRRVPDALRDELPDVTETPTFRTYMTRIEAWLRTQIYPVHLTDINNAMNRDHERWLMLALTMSKHVRIVEGRFRDRYQWQAKMPPLPERASSAS